MLAHLEAHYCQKFPLEKAMTPDQSEDALEPFNSGISGATHAEKNWLFKVSP